LLLYHETLITSINCRGGNKHDRHKEKQAQKGVWFSLWKHAIEEIITNLLIEIKRPFIQIAGITALTACRKWPYSSCTALGTPALRVIDCGHGSNNMVDGTACTI
jgi:hypothetical protein